MTVKTLDHVNIRTALLEQTYAFYTDLLGLRLTPFPSGAEPLVLPGSEGERCYTRARCRLSSRRSSIRST